MNTNKILGVAILTAMLSACTTHHHTVYFAPGSAKLTDASKEVLKGAVSESHAWKKITLTGFTDKTGGKMNNIKLSDKRVAAVNSELIALGMKSYKVRKMESNNSSIDKAVSNLSLARRVDITVR
jgi:cytochrome c oxidase cbb3-type subunit 3